MREVEKTTKRLEKSHGKRGRGEEKSWKGKQGGQVIEREAVPCMRVKQINQQICIIERNASIYIPTITLKRRKKSK